MSSTSSNHRSCATREPARPRAAESAPIAASMGIGSNDKIIVIGASTGGTEALREAMPPDVPEIAVVQHMPRGFTQSFAASLDKVCSVSVAKAISGDRLSYGRVLIAPLRSIAERVMKMVSEGTEWHP